MKPASHQGEEHGTDENNILNKLRAGVLGANDGIVSVSALLLGMVGAGASNTVIITAGVASTIAGAVSMSLGEYVSVSAQRDSEKHLISKEVSELKKMPSSEHEELVQMLSSYGMTQETARKAATEIEQGDPLSVHLKLELGIDRGDLINPWVAAIASALSFLLGAALPILAVLISSGSHQTLAVTVVTLIALAVTGFTSAKLAGTSTGRATLRLVLGGAIGLAVTYGVGMLVG